MADLRAGIEALAERIETAMTDDGHRMPRTDETRYLAHVAAQEALAAHPVGDEGADEWVEIVADDVKAHARKIVRGAFGEAGLWYRNASGVDADAVAAAVVAALDDETARLRAQVVRVRDHDDRMTVQWHEAMHDLAAARAALDRVRAVDEDVLLGQVLRWQREQGLTPDADDDRYAVRAALVFIRAALDSEVTS